MPRPRKEISKKTFENLCALQCTQEEMCCAFDVTDKTLNSWCKQTYKKSFSEVFAIKRGAGKISLRRAQFNLAKKNANMAIWLGKQYLDQKDKTHNNVVLDVENLVPLGVMINSDDENTDH